MTSEVVGRLLRTPAALYRGGTSKALMVRADDLPFADRADVSTWVSAIYGSPDPRQIDGVGGAEPLTSKFAVVGPSTRPDADVDYTFGQVAIHDPFVDWSILCGNISSAVGPFAVQEGMVPAVEPVTTVRIFNTNTGKIVVARVQVADGDVVVEGSTVIDGVPGTGAPILLDFAASAGTRGFGPLPSGRVRDELDVPGIGRITYSVVDVSVPIAFVRAADLGLGGDESAAYLMKETSVREQAAQVRRHVSAALGWASSPEAADRESRTGPGIVVIGPAAAWTTLQRVDLPAEAADFHARAIGEGIVHQAYPVTCSIATGAAAAIEGTVVHDLLGPRTTPPRYRIAHPSGIIETEVVVETGPEGAVLQSAAVVRTARRIMRGVVEIPLSRVPVPPLADRPLATSASGSSGSSG